jgi:hypothetical protein
MCTGRGTVTGSLEGSSNKVEHRKKLLETVGIPRCKIEKVEFRDEREMNIISCNGFRVRWFAVFDLA